MIGLVGHNVLSLDQVARLRAELRTWLERMNLTARLGEGGEKWTFVTPLAPGGDYVLAEGVLEAWRELPSALTGQIRLRVVQAVPLPALVAGFRRQGGFERGTPDGTHTASDSLDDEAVIAQLRRFLERDAVESCDLAAASPREEAFEHGLARNEHYLLTRCDELVVAVDLARYGYPDRAIEPERVLQEPPRNERRRGVLALARRFVASAAASSRIHWLDLRASQ